jgi:hypothetical protein
MQMIGLASNNSATSLTSNWLLLYVPFYTFLVCAAIYKRATAMCAENHLYMPEDTLSPYYGKHCRNKEYVTTVHVIKLLL